MDFLCELIFEVLLEGVFGLTIENPKVKTWVKTLMFLLLSQAMTVLLLLITISAWRDGNSGAIVSGLITALWCVGTLIGAVYGHSSDWKQAI